MYETTLNWNWEHGKQKSEYDERKSNENELECENQTAPLIRREIVTDLKDEIRNTN